ncbi:hypothetical protein [Ferribacterium limneticum]|uniref:hypothetical protein n=1 Tax=Ferribacterium limneticum TaxID=76259 RepID=UPI001CF8A20E|nr:hypothetical protein [Ferribacterium limneticum]UCV22324.1 hypothetical protein KI613_17665 [Ferribacterium limneticum]
MRDFEDEHAVDVMEVAIVMAIIVVVCVHVAMNDYVSRNFGEFMVPFIIVGMKSHGDLEIIEMPMQACRRCQ